MSNTKNGQKAYRYFIAIGAGLLCLFLSPYNIKINTVEFQFDFPWSIAFPTIIALAYGSRHGLIAAFSGAALYPFLVWPQEGYANLLYSAFLIWFFYGTGKLSPQIRSTTADSSKKGFLILSSSIITFFTVAFLLLYKPLLTLNPPFWSNTAITEIPQRVLIAFTIKDTLNFIFIVVLSEILLKLPIVRKTLRLGTSPVMQNNMRIFVWATGATLLMWLAFYSLDYLIISETNYPHKDYKVLVLLIMLYTSGLVARVLIGFIERRTEAEIDLKTSKEKYRILSENANDLIVLMNHDKEIVYISPSVKKTLGRNSTIIIGKKITDYVHEEDIDNLVKYIDYLFKNRITEYHEHRIKKSDDTYIWAESIGNKVSFRGIDFVQLVTRDISPRKQMENNLFEAKLKAEESNRLKSAFLANISHEIRTPMNGIMGFTNLLLAKPNIIEKNKEYLNLILKNSNRLMQLVNDIIEISIIESGKLNLIKQDIHVHNLLSELLNIYYSHANKKNIKIIADIPDIPSPTIQADKSRLKQVFFYLMQNAIKFTEEGTIRFGYNMYPGIITFYISDTGVGIAPEEINNIFERFRQVENEYAKLKGGTGLGLSLCKHITELWGGSIDVESIQNKGSKFTFTVPTL